MKTYTIKKFTFQPIRVVMTILASVLFLLTTTVPAFAFGFGSTPSQPTDGTAQLGKIEQRAEDVASAKAAPSSMEEAEERAKGGINEVQGAADKDKMSRPSNSKGATTVKDQIGEALKKATD